MRKHMRNSKGFTLLELMIVAGIFMLVLIPVLAVFTSSYESYLVQDDISPAADTVDGLLRERGRGGVHARGVPSECGIEVSLG